MAYQDVCIEKLRHPPSRTASSIAISRSWAHMRGTRFRGGIVPAIAIKSGARRTLATGSLPSSEISKTT